MNATTFDTHQAVRRLEAAGIETHQAEAIVSEMRDAAGVDLTDFATKTDLATTKADLEATIAGLRADHVPCPVDSGRGHRRHPRRLAFPPCLTLTDRGIAPPSRPRENQS